MSVIESTMAIERKMMPSMPGSNVGIVTIRTSLYDQPSKMNVRLPEP